MCVEFEAVHAKNFTRIQEILQCNQHYSEDTDNLCAALALFSSKVHYAYAQKVQLIDGLRHHTW